MRPHHVLVVEDDPVAASIVRALVTRQGVTVTVLDDGLDAIAYMTGSPPYHLNPFPSLLVLDLDLPGADGFEILAWMATSRFVRVTPVIVVTASREKRDEERAMVLGATAYFRKPVDAKALGTRIAALLEPTDGSREKGWA